MSFLAGSLVWSRSDRTTFERQRPGSTHRLGGETTCVFQPPVGVQSIQTSPEMPRAAAWAAVIRRLWVTFGRCTTAGRCLTTFGGGASDMYIGAESIARPPAPPASSWPSVIVMITWLDVISGIPSAWTVAVLGRGNEQVLKLPITKSDSVAVGLWDDRVSAMKFEKQPPRPRAVRSTPSSSNSPAAGLVCLLLFVYDQGTAIGPELTIAYVVPSGVATGTRLPVASSPVHRNTLTVETDPPWVKSLTRRMSPSVWVPTNGLPLLVGLAVLNPTGFPKNQNPAVASPLLSNRSRPAYRMMCPLLGSVAMAAYAWVMSFFACGFDAVYSHGPFW